MGWYVLYKKNKVDFDGVHISLEESKKWLRISLIN